MKMDEETIKWMAISTVVGAGLAIGLSYAFGVSQHARVAAIGAILGAVAGYVDQGW